MRYPGSKVPFVCVEFHRSNVVDDLAKETHSLIDEFLLGSSVFQDQLENVACATLFVTRSWIVEYVHTLQWGHPYEKLQGHEKRA